MIQSNMQMPMQQPYPQAGGANAVAINIYNPQAYGSAAQPMQQPYPIQQPIYQMPYMPTYPQLNQMPVAVEPSMYQQYLPVNNSMSMPQVVQEQNFATPAPQMMYEQNFAAPAPQAMPESVISTPAPQAVATDAVQNQVEIVEPQNNPVVVDIDSLIQGLKSTDANVKGQTINQLASYAQETPEIALQIVSEPIMQTLVDVINEDTTGLQGPTPEQTAVAEKIAKGEKLTPEEDALAEQLSPRDTANKNRIFALYTLAMIQKLQRDELNQYIESQKASGQETIAPLNVQDLVGYNDVINVIQNDARPEVKVAAIQALEHVVEPQDKATVEPILTQAQNSSDEAVKSAASEAMMKFAA